MSEISVAVVETTWLHQIVEVDKRDSEHGPILLITMINGHQYAIPLINPQVRQRVYQIASPLTIASDVPRNGSGAI